VIGLASPPVLSGLYRFTTEPFWPGELPKPCVGTRLQQNIPLPEMVISAVDPTAPPMVKWPLSNFFEEFRLDVDGRFPLNIASGRIASEYHDQYWIAQVEQKQPGNIYEGKIVYSFGEALLCNSEVKIWVIRNGSRPHRANVTFLSPSGSERVIVFDYHSPYFREVEFEFDYEAGVQPVTQIGTYDHPDHAQARGLTNETLTIDSIFQRAGFQTSQSNGSTSISSGVAGPDKKWSRRELHDAMRNWWSKCAGKPQWSLWTFFAKEFDEGSDWGGLMFDNDDSHQRQGAVIFDESNLFKPPQSDPKPVEWRKRALFFAAVHEIGHTFNMEHSARKYILHPWRTMTSSAMAGSFMDEPHKFRGGNNENAFFREFLYRFSDEELEFMRHAPNEFVQMGNAAWQTNHGLSSRQAETEKIIDFTLGTDKTSAEYEFLEPVRIKMTLENISATPIDIDESIVRDTRNLTIVIRRRGYSTREYRPYMCTFHESSMRTLSSGECFGFSWLVSAGVDGWYIDEPGYYDIQATLQTGHGRVASNVFQLKVLAPTSFDQLQLAQDYFSDEVGRVLFFSGSRVLRKANDVLALVSEKLSRSRAAAHANISLALPKSVRYKLIEFDTGKPSVRVETPDLFESRRFFERAFHVAEKDTDRTRQSVFESLGYAEAANHARAFANVLLALGDRQGLLKFGNQVKTIKNFEAVSQHLEKDFKSLFQQDQ
jgi:hypothetical protein